jgi:HrpA-like RNA helicase
MNSRDSIIFKYQKIILVSTNIAEASVTIQNLKYIIDCGYYKETFINIKGDEESKLSEINELNRI